MSSSDSSTGDSSFTFWKRTIVTNGALVIGFGGFLLLFEGLWNAFDAVFLVSHPSSPVDALLRYADDLVKGAVLAIFGFQFVERISDADDAINYGIVVGMSGLLLLLFSVGMAFEFMYTMWPSLGVIDVLGRYAEFITVSAFITIFGFGLAPKVSGMRTPIAHIIGVALTIVAVTLLAVGVYLYPIVFPS